MTERNRISAFIVGILVLVTILVIRLFSISVIQHADYVTKADDQQNVVRSILPKRGTIYAQDKAAGQTVAVAQSVERYALSATPLNIEHKVEYAHLFATTFNLDEAKLLASFERKSKYMDPFIHGLTQADVAKVAEGMNALEKQFNPKFKVQTVNFDTNQGNILYFINGTFFVREYSRTYPEGALLGQFMGFVDDKGQGQYGFEGQFDQELRGYQGQVRLERDSAGNLLGENGALNGQDGTGFELTIDRNIQNFIEGALAAQVKDAEAKGGSVIVMNPKTGEIIGMASTPTYDPNNFREAAKQDIGLFDNPAISKQWEPGSIFKPLIMAGAIDQGLVTPDTTETFDESVTVDGYQIHTALRKAYGKESMTTVLVNSDNVAMVWVANKMGNQTVADYLKKFGFNALTGIDLKNEIKGTMDPVEKWSDIKRATTSFGQGIAVTPLQIITAYTAIANNGQLAKPHVVRAVVRPDGTRELTAISQGNQVLKPETAKELREMLTAVVVKEHKRAGVDGYKLGGKTGTAQVPNPDGPGYIENAYNHSFIGMGPADDPQFVVLTKIDQPNLEKVGQFAESTAVPLFSKVANFLLHYYQIPPTNR
jgi:cell division protein FtsI/penicillin-binding protein 2